jgi:hypothetical protein
MTLSAAPPQAPPTAPSGLSLDSARTAPAEKPCPNCQVVVPAVDLFCENCGYDFTTGQLPQMPGLPPVGPASVVTPADTAGGAAPSGQVLTAPPPHAQPGPSQPAQPGPARPVQPQHGSPGQVPPIPPGPLTWVAELWVDPDWFATQESEDSCPSAGMPVIIPLWERSLLIGRVSASRNIHPQIDCGADHGVSRRHAQLTSDGQRWWVEDLQSSNGTFVGVAGAPLPKLPLAAGQRTEFAPGDRVYVGAWTRIVVRKATADEV